MELSPIMIMGMEDIRQSLSTPFKNRLVAFDYTFMKIDVAALLGNSGQQYWKNTDNFLLQMS